MELVKKGWKPAATAWRESVLSYTSYLLPRRGDLPEQPEYTGSKRTFSQMEAASGLGVNVMRPAYPMPPAPPAVPTGRIIGATAKAAAKVVVPPWQKPQPLPKAPSMPTEPTEPSEPIEPTENAEPTEPIEPTEPDEAAD